MGRNKVMTVQYLEYSSAKKDSWLVSHFQTHPRPTLCMVCGAAAAGYNYGVGFDFVYLTKSCEVHKIKGTEFTD